MKNEETSNEGDRLGTLEAVREDWWKGRRTDKHSSQKDRRPFLVDAHK